MHLSTSSTHLLEKILRFSGYSCGELARLELIAAKKGGETKSLQHACTPHFALGRIFQCNATHAVQRDQDHIMRWCALRETFEETGLLLSSAPSADALPRPERLEQVRREVVESPSAFESLARQCAWLKPTELHPWSRWVTPKNEYKSRFDTFFYVHHYTGSAEALGCERETQGHQWMSAEEAVAAHEARSIWLAPPTWITLQEIVLHRQLSSLLKAAHSPRDMTPLEATIINEKQSDNRVIRRVCFYGDEDNELHPIKGQRRRLVFDVKKFDYRWEVTDGVHPHPWATGL
eukprot:TRINITY_DN2466_c0_g1_i4.p1 TRINITY_DN2466_c0_g1~~TRINITY_DN2466_c0_g1_i4.p1  ORF type:complete len:291 (+),score=26.18 TRINITY_DN2466_c0_g1_i4:398-1270(+)